MFHPIMDRELLKSIDDDRRRRLQHMHNVYEAQAAERAAEPKPTPVLDRFMIRLRTITAPPRKMTTTGESS